MERYTSKELVANILGISEDLIQTEWLDWATAQVDLKTHQTFGNFTVVERYDGTDLDFLLLDNSPVVSVTKIEYLEDDTTDTWIELDDKYYVLYRNENRIRLVEDLSGVTEISCFEIGVQNWRVTYEYGHSEVPAEVELLASLMVVELYNIKTTGVSGTVSSEKIGDYSISYNSSASIPVKDLIKELIDSLGKPDIGVVGV